MIPDQALLLALLAHSLLLGWVSWPSMAVATLASVASVLSFKFYSTGAVVNSNSNERELSSLSVC